MGKNSGEHRMQVLIMRQNAACEECRARMTTAEFVVYPHMAPPTPG